MSVSYTELSLDTHFANTDEFLHREGIPTLTTNEGNSDVAPWLAEEEYEPADEPVRDSHRSLVRSLY